MKPSAVMKEELVSWIGNILHNYTRKIFIKTFCNDVIQCITTNARADSDLRKVEQQMKMSH
jgi:hypothetical protein